MNSKKSVGDGGGGWDSQTYVKNFVIKLMVGYKIRTDMGAHVIKVPELIFEVKLDLRGH